jgi:hypothetical protein
MGLFLLSLFPEISFAEVSNFVKVVPNRRGLGVNYSFPENREKKFEQEQLYPHGALKVGFSLNTLAGLTLVIWVIGRSGRKKKGEMLRSRRPPMATR